MSENLPIIWDDKVNSPELLAYFQQFGKNTYVSAEELNQIRDGINELSFPNGFIKTSPLTRVDNEISIAPLDFKWILNKIIFENTNSYSTTINAALDGYYRKDIIVANASGSFQKVEGHEFVDIAFRPDLPLNTLLVYEIDVFGASVIGSTSPVVSNYIEKGEFAESTMTGDSYMHFGIPQYSSVRFVGNATVFKGVYLFPGYKAYSGKKLTLKNFQTTDILLKHLHPDALLNTQLYFPNKADYILKPGKIIEFSLSMIANRFEFIGDSEDVSGKEDVTNKTGTVIGNESSTSRYLHIAGQIAYFQQKLTDVVFGAFQSVLPTVTTVADTDKVPFLIGSLSRMMTLANFKTLLKNYFDTQYKSDTISLSMSDTSSILVAGDTDSINAPYNFTLLNYWVGVKTAPTVTGITVDVKKNGISITSTKAGIDPTEKTSLTGTAPVITTTSFNKGDEITPNIFAVGSLESGRALKLYLEIIKT